MMIRQTRIFVPFALPFEDSFWCETVIGSIIAPLVGRTKWFWFSRYIASNTDSGDCNINEIPEEYAIEQNSRRIYRSLRFRYQISDNLTESFEADTQELINQHGCAISDFREYRLIDDLGGDRFVGGVLSEQRRSERATLVVKYLHTISQIYINSLIGPNDEGKFQLEISNSRENPHGSIFESLHHLFCNITNVPLRVLVSSKGIGTDWCPPSIPDGESVSKIKIRY